MNKKILAVVAAAAIVLVGGALAFKGMNSSTQKETKGAIEIQHKLGTTNLEGAPERVVVLDYGALDLLNEMEAEIVGVPKSGKLPKYLDKFASDEYANVGSVKEPNLEAINELDPDLIVMAGRMQDYYDELSQIAPTVFVESDGSNYIESFNKTVEMFGDVFNKEDKANEMIENVKAKANEVKEKVEKLNSDAALVMVNGRGISAYGAGSRFGLLFNELGFTATDSNVEDSTHGQEVTFEYLLNQNPKYLFVVDRNSITGSEDITAESVIENEITKQTDAYKNGNIVYLNSTNWYTVSGGYTSTLSMIEEVNNAVK